MAATLKQRSTYLCKIIQFKKKCIYIYIHAYIGTSLHVVAVILYELIIVCCDVL